MIRYMDPVPQSARFGRGLAILGAWGLVSWLAGCSVLVDANRPQCSTNADCTNRGAEFAGAVCKDGLCESDSQWSCGAVNPPDAPAYKLTMHFTDAVDSKKVLQGITARLCRKLDVMCESPVGPAAVADETGTVVMQVEKGFDGFVQLTDSKIAPSMYFLTPPQSGDLELPMVPLASPFVASSIVLQAGGTTWQKDTRGIVLLTAFDCTGTQAANINFSVGGAPDPEAFTFYLVDNLPTTTVSVTDSTGYGGLVNVAAGVTTISASLGPGGRKVSKISVLVRPGFVSYSRVFPNPL